MVNVPPPRHIPNIAYFSMEIALESRIPTYSGGLGILAGDFIKSAADMGIPMVGVTLLYRKGYFRQHLDPLGNQTETPVEWDPEEFMEPLTPRVSVKIEGREVWIRAWRYIVTGYAGHTVPVYFLDSDLPVNAPADRALTDYLYGGDERYRLCQETVLGMGGVDMLQALGHDIQLYHLNEGHPALLTLALLDDRTELRSPHFITKTDIEAVRQQCVFTTHTPVPAAVDQFPLDMVKKVLDERFISYLVSSDSLHEGNLNMVYLALFFSRYINGVAMRHGEISRGLYPNYPINSITNGVHAVTWTSLPFHRLYDRYIPEWRHDNLYLRYAISIPPQEIWKAHQEAKKNLLNEIEKRTGRKLDPGIMTLGFARRATAYKRPELLFSDTGRLKHIAANTGKMQIIFGGKAHPRDTSGKEDIRHIFQYASVLKDSIPVIYLEEYDMDLSRYMISGSDLWLNTPLKPLEASGTSGMKAALNAVPQFSVLDGWWVEGHVEGVTGWSIGDNYQVESDPEKEVNSMYDKLEKTIVPMFYHDTDAYIKVMLGAISLNGSYFNTQRMLSQYVVNAYMAGG
jgi:glycogen phosphorylase